MYAQIPGHERDIDKSESFSSRNRGQVPLPIDATLARINADVYEANAHSIVGWSPLGDQEQQRERDQLAGLLRRVRDSAGHAS